MVGWTRNIYNWRHRESGWDRARLIKLRWNQQEGLTQVDNRGNTKKFPEDGYIQIHETGPKN